MDMFTVAFHGFQRNAESAARSMVQLLLPLLGNRWSLGEPSSSDVVILEADALDELVRADSVRPEALYIALDDAGTKRSDAFATIQRPLNSARIIDALNLAQAEFEKRRLGSGVATTLIPQGIGDDTPRGARTSLRTAIRWVLFDRSRPVSILNQRQSRIFSVSPERGFTTRLTAPELADLVRSDISVSIFELNEEELAKLNSRKSFEPFTKLEWIYWLTGSNGELRSELKVSRPYRLRRWPDFGHLPHHRADVAMASLLKAESLTVGELAERAGVRLETACNFVNACSALGFLMQPKSTVKGSGKQPSNVAPADAGEVEDETSGVFSSVRRALGLSKRRPDGSK